MLNEFDISILRCPFCTAPLTFRGGTRHRRLKSGAFHCAKCQFIGPLSCGLPDLHHEKVVRGSDRIMRFGYNRFALQHDIGLRFFLPAAQDFVTEAQMRAIFLSRLHIEHLRPRPDGEPLRILEVGVGTGSNLPLIIDRISKHMPVELWGCDLSEGMLERASSRVRRFRLRSTDGRPPRLFIADAHSLPFASGTFDRVLHVGGIGAFQSPMRAMREMARVARPSSEVVVVDENLDPAKSHSLFHKLAFWSLTALDPNPHPPREGIPFGSTILADDQISRFYYCLAFRTPATAPRA